MLSSCCIPGFSQPSDPVPAEYLGECVEKVTSHERVYGCSFQHGAGFHDGGSVLRTLLRICPELMILPIRLVVVAELQDEYHSSRKNVLDDGAEPCGK